VGLSARAFPAWESVAGRARPQSGSMIGSLVPPVVVAYEEFGDVPGEAPFRGEEDLVASAADGRRSEFVTARRCARRALAKLGLPSMPIRQGPSREPLWPAGIAGSITHCAGYRAAAVAELAALAGLGIDAEPNAPLPRSGSTMPVPAVRTDHLCHLDL